MVAQFKKKIKNAVVDLGADKSLMTDTNGKFYMDVYLKNRDKIIANRNNDGARTNGTIDCKEYRKNRKSIIARGTGE